MATLPVAVPIDMTVGIPNEDMNRQALAGIEAIKGVAVAPTHKLPGKLTLGSDRALVRTEKATGGYDRYQGLKYGNENWTGNYGASMTFQDAPLVADFTIGKVVHSAVPNTTLAYQHRAVTNFSRDDLESLTVVHGIDGYAWQATGVTAGEFTLTGDIDDADNAFKIAVPVTAKSNDPLTQFEGVATAGTATSVTMTGAALTASAWVGDFITLDYGSGRGAVREITANTADTVTWTVPVAGTDIPSAGTAFLLAPSLPVVADEDTDTISVQGARLFIDLYGGSDPIGTTEITDRMISLSLTQSLNRTQKKFWSGTSAKSSRGGRVITAAFTFELDHWDEYKHWREGTPLAIRVAKEGEQIDTESVGSTPVYQLMQWDFGTARYDTYTEGTRDNNMTVTIGTVLELPVGAEPTLALDIINERATF